MKPASGSFERDEYETRGEPVVGVAFEQEWEEAAILIVALLSEQYILDKNKID